MADVVHRFDWLCHAFCLMTNHYHLVVAATQEDLSDGFQHLNGVYAQGFNAKYGRWAISSGIVFGAPHSTKKSSNPSADT